MIIHQSICDSCGTITEIREGGYDFVLECTVTPAMEYVMKNTRFVKSTSHVFTFCSSECAGNWFKKNVKGGKITALPMENI